MEARELYAAFATISRKAVLHSIAVIYHTNLSSNSSPVTRDMKPSNCGIDKGKPLLKYVWWWILIVNVTKFGIT